MPVGVRRDQAAATVHVRRRITRRDHPAYIAHVDVRARQVQRAVRPPDDTLVVVGGDDLGRAEPDVRRRRAPARAVDQRPHQRRGGSGGNEAASG